MLFNSFQFLCVFLPIVGAVYYYCARHGSARIAQICLVIVSFVFYGLQKPVYLPLLLASIVANFLFGRGIARLAGKRRKQLLVVALVANIVFLSCFKYWNLVLRHLPYLQGKFHFPDWELPLGISFFTLQQIMYLVDCYEEIVPANGFLAHAAFVSFFPSVASGPLTRARLMVPQLISGVSSNAPKISQGISLLAIGLFKKVVLADSVGRIADAGFTVPGSLSALEAWASSLSFTFQIYFDFSGYSDMAIGIALLLGYTLPINFNTPYRSLSITEFWQRWHITLSQFITNYLYTPILRSFRKITLVKAAAATLLAMTIAGLWHGPSFTFVIFGLLHGIALAVNQVWRRKARIRLPGLLSWILTFLFVNFAFIFFRAPNLAAGLQVSRALVSFHDLFTLKAFAGSIRMIEMPVICVPAIAGIIVALFGENSNVFALKPRITFSTALVISLLMLISFIFMNSNVAKEFVYFGF